MNDAIRPSMRRKSSAQNILSSFKSQPTPVPPPLNLSASNVSSSTAPPSSYTAASTPIATTPLPKPEWDAQSLHSDTVASSLAGAQSPQLGGPPAGAAQGQGTPIEWLRERAQRRILILTYIRNIHEGQSHWFHTIQVSRSELDKVFNNTAMKKRTYRFAVLALSLSPLLDIQHPQDLLRGLLNTITEFEQAKEEGDTKGKMRLKFNKSKNQRKGASGIAEFTGSFPESSSDASYLFAPSIPFPLDYHETLLSLLDVLSEVYNKLSRLLGPSPLPQPPLGPLAGLTPRPGVSYLFAGDGTTSIASTTTAVNGNNSSSYAPLSPTSTSAPGGGIGGLGGGSGYHTPYHHSNTNLPSIASTMSVAAGLSGGGDIGAIGDANNGNGNHNTNTASSNAITNSNNSTSIGSGNNTSMSSTSGGAGQQATASSAFSASTGPSAVGGGGANGPAGSLWEVANGSSSGMMMHNVGLGGPPVNWTNTLSETITKIDGKLKKIIATLLKDLDAFARNSINDELSRLDPLLRNMDPGSAYGQTKITYDFDNN